ncbi:MAG: phosphonate ABC transporter, permease protein PhnE [Hyphomicrobiaceae bacterium TMED74]|nr:phosphonate ABC transporter, permease protein PhnE [Filomicrobium sp.]RPG47020.1 MAG: phosphonate ABC transporter, permease protein PhnE [Hyphomicrobiaceae bacterium TMED74]
MTNPAGNNFVELNEREAAAVATLNGNYRALQQARSRQLLIGVALFALLFYGATIAGRFDPLVLWDGAPKLGDYVYKTLPVLRWDHLFEDFDTWFYGIGKWLGLIIETVLMAYLSTLIGSGLALLLCFHASRNLNSSGWSYFLARRLFEFCRSVPDLVFALIFVFAFGIGPLPGILAIAIHTLGANGKLFAEANENIDVKPIDGMRASGANWVQTIRYGVIPQVLPNYASYVLWRLEINVRAATVMGFVGAGGIGFELIVAVRSLYYEDISAMLVMIVATVALIDIACAKLRYRLIGTEAVTS